MDGYFFLEKVILLSKDIFFVFFPENVIISNHKTSVENKFFLEKKIFMRKKIQMCNIIM